MMFSCRRRVNYSVFFSLPLEKLKRLKVVLKTWSREFYGDGASLSRTIRANLFAVQNSILQCNAAVEMSVLSAQENKLATELAKAIIEESKMAKQKCKNKWKLFGDKNTSFFHDSLKIRQAENSFPSLLDSEGRMCSTADDIQNAFLQYFTSILGNAPFTPISLSSFSHISFLAISDDLKANLITQISDEDIVRSIFSMKSSSSPGPDGFNAHFYKFCWGIVGGDVIKAIKNFFSHSKMLGGINATRIALIPKSDMPNSVSHFRPIACCNVIYKSISKILASRMKVALADIISSNQSAFLPKRDIADNITLASELMRGYNRRLISPRCVMKLDIQKAYDSVRWDVIIYVLFKMNFPIPFLCWIFTCISTAHISLSINGSSFGYFKAKNGLQQGDPISPYLFVCVMELFTSLSSNAFLSKHIDYHPYCKRSNITSLLFADDLLLFTKPNAKSINGIHEVLQSLGL